MRVEVGHFFSLISASLSIGSFVLPYLVTPNFGGWTLKNYPRLLIDMHGDLLFLTPIIVASISQLEIFLALFMSNTFRKIANRLIGLVALAIGSLLTYGTLMLHEFFWYMVFGNVVADVHIGYSAYLITLSYFFMALSGLFLMLFPLSTTTQKVPLEEDQPDTSDSKSAKSTSDSLRQRKPTPASAPSTKGPQKFKTAKVPTKPSKFAAINGLILFLLFAGSFTLIKLNFTEISHCSVTPNDLKFSEEGFKAHLYAEHIQEARSMALGSKALFVSTRKLGSLYAVYDHDGDYKADEIITFATDLFQPNGIAYKDGDLYVAEIPRFWRYKNIEAYLKSPVSVSSIKNISGVIHKTVQLEHPAELLTDKFPSDIHHGWKYLSFGPDGLLYTPLGSPCNVCLRPDDERFSTILRQKKANDWNDWEIVAHGVRNSVGFDWHPITKELWFTENGRDFMDHNLPPDELNRVKKVGDHFGFPYCFGYNVRDKEILPNETVDCNKFKGAEMELAPHAAALGIKFYKGNMFPERYKNSAIIAEHGSWNRIPPIGYRLTLVPFNENNDPYDLEEFVGGFLKTLSVGNVLSHQEGCGRPVDILELPDGSVLFTDDMGGKIFRITYEEPEVIFE